MKALNYPRTGADELTRRHFIAHAARSLLGVGLLPNFFSRNALAADAAQQVGQCEVPSVGVVVGVGAAGICPNEKSGLLAHSFCLVRPANPMRMARV